MFDVQRSPFYYRQPQQLSGQKERTTSKEELSLFEAKAQEVTAAPEPRPNVIKFEDLPAHIKVLVPEDKQAEYCRKYFCYLELSDEVRTEIQTVNKEKLTQLQIIDRFSDRNVQQSILGSAPNVTVEDIISLTDEQFSVLQNVHVSNLMQSVENYPIMKEIISLEPYVLHLIPSLMSSHCLSARGFNKK